MLGNLYSRNSIHVIRKPHVNICSEGRLALRGKQNIFALKLKLKAKCLFSLTAGRQLCAYCWLDPFLSKHPALQKTQPLPRFLPSKSFCCHGNLMFSGNQASSTLPYIYEQCSNSGWSLLETQGIYPVTTIPIFTCSNTRHQQYLTVHREPGLLQNKQMHPERGRAGWEWEPSFIL